MILSHFYTCCFLSYEIKCYYMRRSTEMGKGAQKEQRYRPKTAGGKNKMWGQKWHIVVLITSTCKMLKHYLFYRINHFTSSYVLLSVHEDVLTEFKQTKHYCLFNGKKFPNFVQKQHYFFLIKWVPVPKWWEKQHCVAKSMF